MSHVLETKTEPTCFGQAIKDPQWRAAVSAEFQALQSQGTWDLIPSSSKYNVLGCKWIFKIKRNMDGSIARHKARLVAQGYQQEFGIDYEETFSPVAKMPTLRTLLTMTVTKDWPILQLDVSNVFLHGDIDHKIYMVQPPGFQDPLYPNHICILKKAIYGLKQAPRQWFATLSSFLHSIGFVSSREDPSLMLFHKLGICMYLLIYVDDILLTGNDQAAIQTLFQQLNRRFRMKNLGSLSNFLGIEAHRSSTGITLSQSSYALQVMQCAAMIGCKTLSTPASMKEFSSAHSMDDFENPSLYRKIVGKLQYLTITRPDIAYAVNRACQAMHKPLQIHYQNLKRIIRYIQGTVTHQMLIQKSDLTLHAFADSDWASDQTTRKSTSGNCMFLGKNLISWSVKKQNTVARSSTEAEYRALAAAATEIAWLRRLLHEFDAPQPAPTILFCDNISAISLANNPVFHARTKHIEVDYHFIRDYIKSKYIQVHHIRTEDQLADILTKPLSSKRHQHLMNKLTVHSRTVTLRGDDNQIKT